MTFDEVLDQVRELLRQRGRVTYRSLKLRYQLDDEVLAGVSDELISAERVAVDEDGKVLVWVDKETGREKGDKEAARSQVSIVVPPPPTPSPQSLTERRQLTVMFCDLVGSTALSAQLDPEEYREVVQQYQDICTSVIQRYEGHIAQHLGDGLLVYFGYPTAHEDDAARAVRTGLEIIAALRESALQDRHLPHPIQVRIGIHTGLVVIGEIGSSEKREILALGETPNLAARVQGVAEPDTVVMSVVTQRLVQGLFACQGLGPQALKGIAAPVSVYRIIGKSGAQSRFEVAVTTGLTPLVGREEELGLLERRWRQAKEGTGQVVLLSGEPGIGKSHLVQTVKEQVLAEGAIRIEFRCSPYHQNSAFYPIIDHLQRLLQFQREDTPHAKLVKLQQLLAAYRFPHVETLSLFASLLSLPQPADVPPLTLSPQKQKQKTQEALVAWIIEEAQQAAVYCAWEDLHWADPSTLEVLTLFLEQIPTARVFAVLTFRPEFTPPWSARSYLTQLTLNRLGRTHVEAMVKKVTDGKSLPVEVLHQIVTKTDGVPLFVEELTKMVVESGLLTATDGHYELTGSLPPLAIPSTLQDSLMARLDRLAPVREIAQVGAVLGREFSYELLQAVSTIDETLLQQGLRKLVEAELIYQRGLLPQATYLFKHALIQDTAYQSLLKSRRQQLHQQITQVLIGQFPETVESQPELLAHHYTEAGIKEQAIPYWQKAGQRAGQRLANVEAISHLTKALELLKTLPDTPERAQQELTLQIALGAPLIATKGYSAAEFGQIYHRAHELCQQLGELPELFPTLYGLTAFSIIRGKLQAARELSEQLLRLADSTSDSAFLVLAQRALGTSLLYLGEFASAQEHFKQGLAVYDPRQHRSLMFVYGIDPKVACLHFTIQTLWYLGYPDQALQRSHEALSWARELAHPYGLSGALYGAAWLHHQCGDVLAMQARAEDVIALCTEQGFSQNLAISRICRGWALAEQQHLEDGIIEMNRGLAECRAIELSNLTSYHLALLGDVYGKSGQVVEGLTAVAEGLATADNTGERTYEAELYRIKGQLVLQGGIQSPTSKVTNSSVSGVQRPESEAEECFLRAIDIAQKQQAKSLELRAAMSLARLWQQQGKKSEAHKLLSDVYNWFTEGFDTKDLQEAKALLQELT